MDERRTIAIPFHAIAWDGKNCRNPLRPGPRWELTALTKPPSWLGGLADPVQEPVPTSALQDLIFGPSGVVGLLPQKFLDSPLLRSATTECWTNLSHFRQLLFITLIPRSLTVGLDGGSRCVQEVRLRAGFALAVFAFSNTQQQFAIRQAGGLSLSCLQSFLDSDDEIERATAAFQVIQLLVLLLLQQLLQLLAQHLGL